MADWQFPPSEPDYIPDVNTQQPGDEQVLHRRVGTGHNSDDDDDGSTSDTSSVYSTSTTSGVSYSEESGELLEKPDRSSSSDIDDIIPASFKKGPYMYYGRTFIVSVPGLLLTLAVGGETLLAVMTCGGLMVQLCLRSGNKSRSLMAYVVAFIATQIIVLYSIVPLLWKSVYTYIVIVPTINVFTMLTGAWLLLSFDNFVCHEHELAQCIEVLLFTLYPVLCLVSLSWLSITLIPTLYTPYVFTITGFTILQYYLVPVPSSYRKPVPHLKDNCNVLDPVYPACFALFFCFTPLSVFLVIKAATGVGQAFLVATVVECFFIISLSIFLATFFNVREFLEGGGLSYCYITITRQCCGYASVLAFCQLLYCRNVLSHLLPWLPVAIILHMIIGALWSCRKKKMYLQIVSVTLCLYYILLFCELPWTLNYYIGEEQVAIGVVFGLLLTNCLLTVACMYVSLYHTTETFGSFLLVQTLGFVLLEMLLLSSGLYSLLLMASVTALLIYVVLRLHYSKKLLWQPALGIVSVHLTVLWNAINIIYPSMQREVTTSHMADLFDFLAAWLLLTNLCGMHLATWTEILDKRKTQLLLASSWLMSMLAARAFVPKLVWLIAGRKEPCLADVLAFSSAVVCVVSMKMTIGHRTLWKPNKHIGTVSLMLTVLLIAVQPTCQLTRCVILKWLLHGSAVCGLLVVTRATTLNSMTRLHIASIVIGVPVGLELAELVFDDTMPTSVRLLYTLLTTVCVQLALATWTPVHNLESVIISRLGVLLVTSLVLSIMDWFTKSTAQVGGHHWPPGMLGRAGFSLVAATVLKTTSFLQESEYLTAHGSLRKSKLPILGNVLTAVAFLSVCHLQPLTHWEPWVMMCSSITFLFQRDPIVLYDLQRTNQITLPVLVATVTIMGSAIFDCHIWSSHLLSLKFLLHLLELGLILVQVPVLLVFFNILWSGEFYINERFVIFLMPLASLLLVIGSSYIAVVFGLYTLLVGMWLMIYKLPLAVIEEED